MLFDLDTPKYLIRDRDTKYGNLFSEGINHFGIKQIITAYKSPWQNSYVEGVIGSIRRECLEHIIILNESHLRIVQIGMTKINKRKNIIGVVP